MTDKKIRKATVHEVIEIHELLKAHLHKTPEEGVWVYEEGWSDTAIAETVSEDKDLSGSAVARIRQEMFGKLKPTGVVSAGEVDKIKSRLVQAELRLDRLESQLSQADKGTPPLQLDAAE